MDIDWPHLWKISRSYSLNQLLLQMKSSDSKDTTPRHVAARSSKPDPNSSQDSKPSKPTLPQSKNKTPITPTKPQQSHQQLSKPTSNEVSAGGQPPYHKSNSGITDTFNKVTEDFKHAQTTQKSIQQPLSPVDESQNVLSSFQNPRQEPSSTRKDHPSKQQQEEIQKPYPQSQTKLKSHTSMRLPFLSSQDCIQTEPDILTPTSRSMAAKRKITRTKDEKEVSVAVSHQHEDLSRIMLSPQTKDALSKIQKYDKEFSQSVNEKQLKNAVDNESKRLEKIKNINKSMRGTVYDNEITITALSNVLRFQQDLNKDVRERELIEELNKELQSKVDEITRTKNEEIKELKLELKGKSSDDNARSKALETEIKDFHKANEILVPLLRENNFDKGRKILEAQIKRLGNDASKEISLVRKQLLQIILSLINQRKDEISSKNSIQSSSSPDIREINSLLTLLFEAQPSLERNISHLERQKRLTEPKIHDTKLFELKEFHQTMSQGASYITSLYQQLREKTNEIVSLNRKMADMDRAMQKNDKHRTESLEKGDKIIEELKDGLERERRQGKEMLNKLSSMEKEKSKETEKGNEKEEILLNEWNSTMQGILEKIDNEDSSWTSEIPRLRKGFLGKKDLGDTRFVVEKDIRLLETLVRSVKLVEKLSSGSGEAEKKRESLDLKLDFKSTELEKKYLLEKEKVEDLQAEKTALSKSLKQLQREKGKVKEPQYDELANYNKLCHSVDSILKTPFNKDTWGKVLSRLQNRSDTKTLITVSSTLENLFNKLYQLLLQNRLVKGAKLQSSVIEVIKQPIKEEKYGNEELITELFGLLKEIVDNEEEIDKYVEIINMMPSLLGLLSQKIQEGGERLGRISELETELDRERIQRESSLVEDTKPGFSEEVVRLRQQVSQLESEIQSNQSKHRQQIHYLRQQSNRSKQELEEDIDRLKRQIQREKEIIYYKGKMVNEKEREVETLTQKVKEHEEEIQHLRQSLDMANYKSTSFIGSSMNLLKPLPVEMQRHDLEREVPTLSNMYPLKKSVSYMESQTEVDFERVQEEVRYLREELQLRGVELERREEESKYKGRVIGDLQLAETHLKLQIDQMGQLIVSLQDALETEAAKSVNQTTQQRLHELQRHLVEKEESLKDTQLSSEKYKTMFEDCCHQMSEIHHIHQQQISSLTQMHLKNQQLLEEEISILKKDNIKLRHTAHSLEQGSHHSSNSVREELERRVGLLEQQNYTVMDCNNQLESERLEYIRENAKLKEKVLTLERRAPQDESSEELGKSGRSLVDKRLKKLNNRSSNKLNRNPYLQSPNNELSSQLSHLLEGEGKISASSLRQIIEAVNMLITSNKKLVERVKRTERENHSLYEAVNNLTAEEQELGEGISIIMHLQNVLGGVAEWLDEERIATEEDLKLSHFFERLQSCLSKNNHFRYVQIFEEFLQHTICVVFEHGSRQLQLQNHQIDRLREKLVVALDEHLHSMMDEDRKEKDGNEEAQILRQVRVLLGVFLKTRNLKVVEDLVDILDAHENSFEQ